MFFTSSRKLRDFKDEVADLKAESRSLRNDLAIEKKKLTQEFELDKKKYKAEFDFAKSRLEDEKLSFQTMVTLKKDAEVADLKVVYEKKLLELGAKVTEEISVEKGKLYEDLYTKMSDNLEEVHSKGNATTKFMEKLSLKMMDNHPSHTEKIDYTETTVKKRK